MKVTIKTKICTKCERELSATTKYFYPDKGHKGGIHSWCKVCCRGRAKERYQKNSEGIKERSKIYHQLHPEYNKEHHKKNYATINGYLRQTYNDIQKRCTNPKRRDYERYGGRGIKNKFKSREGFTNYVLNVLKIDPRGLQTHRIDNDGHYEKGNIEFLTPKEHGLKHGRAA